MATDAPLSPDETPHTSRKKAQNDIPHRIVADTPNGAVAALFHRATVAPRFALHGGKMRQQTKPFIVEIKQTRKPKTLRDKASIWGKLDIAAAADDAYGAETAVQGIADRGGPASRDAG